MYEMNGFKFSDPILAQPYKEKMVIMHPSYQFQFALFLSQERLTGTAVCGQDDEALEKQY